MAQGVKDVVLSQLWLRSLLWCRFSPWPGNFYMVQTQGKKKGDWILHEKNIARAY